MSNYVIVTDSSCDLPAHLVEELELHTVPLAFLFGEKTYYNYPDNREMSPKAFYDRLRAGEMATTNAINVGQVTDFLTPFLEEGKDILILSFSSGLSTSFNSYSIAAQDLAEQYPDRTIRVIDTLCASLGQGMLVYQAAQLRQAGKSLDEVAQWVEDNKLRQCHWFTVDDLFFLKRGGRVSAATAVVGTMLQIKPVLHVDNEGHLIPVSKVRGRKQSLDALVKRMEETAQEPAGQMVFISHGDCLEDARYVERQVREKLGVQQVEVGYIGPVIGAHSGPGTVALFFLGKER